MDPERKSLLMLYLLDGIGSARLRLLKKRFGSFTHAASASISELTELAGIDKKIAIDIHNAVTEEKAEQQLATAERLGVRVLTIWDPEYPDSLKNIFDPPTVLFVRGRIDSIDRTALAIVGTRRPSQYGKLATEKFTRELVSNGVTIISGLARGIDTVSHQTSIQHGGRTIAVLGCGQDVFYPPENRGLVEKIKTNGAVISEFVFGTKPDAPNFPRRNRIVSGLSLGVFVIEAGEKSGALITANYALEQNREVFALPGNIYNPRSLGCNRLLQSGAKLVIRVEDILDEIQPQLNSLLKKPVRLNPVVLNENEKKILDLLTSESMHIDSIAIRLQMAPAKALGVLLTLELKNLVRQLPGKYFIRL